MNDAVLVADASRMQDVRNVVDHLEQAGVSQANQHAKDYRPWGWFESLVTMPGYQVKRLHVYPGRPCHYKVINTGLNIGWWYLEPRAWSAMMRC